MYIFIILTFFSTILGGLLALKYSHKLNTILGFTAGVLIAVVAFDILPEMVHLSSEAQIPFSSGMIALVAGFLLFHILEKIVLIHHNHENDYHSHHHPSVGSFSAMALIAHSFLDGVGIGLAFQASAVTGVAVAFAVIAHDFSDGLNTVSLMLAHKNSKQKAFTFLLLAAIAPVLGGLSTLFFSFSESFLLLYLGFFAGFLLYIGASDILPEAHSEKSNFSTLLATVSGSIFIYFIVYFLTR
jgi:ZIP family zinc transporter